MKQEENVGKKSNNNEILNDSIIEEMVYYLYSKGMVLKNKENTGVVNVPVCIFPSPIPRALFNKIEFYQIAFNKMIDKMSRDVEFLKNTLSPLAESDYFIKKHLEILDASESNKNKQNIQLGIFRNDFMIDKFKNFIYQIEINTIASSMGFFSDALLNFNKHFLKKYPEIYKKLYAIEGDGKRTYQVPYDRPEVISTIADSMNQALEIYISNLNNSNNLLNAMNSSNYFSKTNVSVLFVVQENERNIFDQRAIENQLYEKYEIDVLRYTLQEINVIAKLDTNGELTINDKLIGLVYFRGGYDEKDFPNEECWNARKTIELSNSIKCPNINTFLCTFKIFQYELTKNNVLSKYIPEQLIADDIRRFFTKIFFVNKMVKEERIEIFKTLSTNPEKFVVKPQKEGGGNNYYNRDILTLLPENLESDEINQVLQNSIIMERIFPPNFETYIIKENKLKIADCVSEFSIYGVILSNSENTYLINKPAGFLVRTKEMDCNEGGVASGFSAIDLPSLTIPQ